MSDLPNNLSFLTEDLSGVSTSMPLVAAGLYNLSLAKAEVKPTRDGSGNNLSLTWKTTGPVSEAGKPDSILNPGWTIFDNIGLTPSEKYPVENIKRRVASVIQALGVKTLEDILSESSVGKVAKANVIVSPERVDKNTGRRYDAANEIKTYIRIG